MSKKNGKKSLWQEFKEFAIKGNAMALAVGTIIGTAFGTITKSLTNDIIMPIVNIFLGGTDFAEMKLALPRAPWVEPTYTDVLDEAGNIIGQEEVINYLTWGNFLSAVINFIILAFVVFMLVKGLNKLSEIGKKKEEEPAAPAEPPAPPAPSNEEVLLGEIRDLLKNQK
jgi:large conductance mechanosensitive channel